MVLQFHHQTAIHKDFRGFLGLAVERGDVKGINFMGQFSKKVKQFRQYSDG